MLHNLQVTFSAWYFLGGHLFSYSHTDACYHRYKLLWTVFIQSFTNNDKK